MLIVGVRRARLLQDQANHLALRPSRLHLQWWSCLEISDICPTMLIDINTLSWLLRNARLSKLPI